MHDPSSPPAPSPSTAPAITEPAALLSIKEAIAGLDPSAQHHPWIWVEGEIRDLSGPAGHRYFTLADADAQIPCVLWERVARGIHTPLAEGTRVRVHGWVQPHPRRGHPEIDVRDVVIKDALGPRAATLQERRAKLEAEGLLDPARRRPLPEQPACVGVITSLAGSVVHDIIRVLQRRAPGLLVQVVSTRVTGEGAAEEVAGAIQALGTAGTASVLIVARGGGSAGDLAPFNSEAVVRAIAECPVPVISAIGHEPDVTLADEVADVRAATPSEAAELAIPDRSGSSGAMSEAATELCLQLHETSVVVRIPARVSSPSFS